MSKCTRCDWYKNTPGVNCIKYLGNKNADLIFLGEAFGKTEVQTGKAFTGDAGDIFDKLLGKIKIKRQDVGIINSMRCYQEGNPTPSKKDMDKCFPYTYMDIRKVKPKLVVAMGNAALYQATGREGITNYRGRLLWSEKLGCKVMPTFHPASVLYDRNKLSVMFKDFQKIPTYLEADPDSLFMYPYEYITDEERFFEILPKLEQGTPNNEIYVDSECTGLSPYKNELRTLQLAVSPDMIYILSADVVYRVRDTLKHLLESREAVGQNLSFDAKFLHVKLGIKLNWGYDTAIAEYVLSGMGGNNLTSLVWKYCPESGGYDEEVERIGGAHLVGSMDTLLPYAANDVGVLFKIKKEQIDQLHDENMWFVFNNIILPCDRVLTYMSLRGVKYDLTMLEKVDKWYEKKGMKALAHAKELEAVKACEKHFRRTFNPRSYDMVRWVMLEYYDLPVLTYGKATKSGKRNPSVGEKEMAKYAETYNNPYAQIMERYRGYQTMRSNFLSGQIPKLIGDEAHTNYSLYGTNSSRPNSKNPNLLNLPTKDAQEQYSVKQCIIARPGFVFLAGDLSQIEVRMAAVIYNDSGLIEICNSDDDFHSLVACKCWPQYVYEEFYRAYKDPAHPDHAEIKEIRRQAKTITFGILYQMGPEKLASDLGFIEQLVNQGLDRDEAIQQAKLQAIKFIDDYFDGFPSLKDNIEKTKREVIDKGYVDTYFGFRRRWKFHKAEDHHTQREAVNHKIQGVAWQLEALALNIVDQKLEDMKSGLVLQVYDSMVTETDLADELDEVAYIMTETCENINKPYDLLNKVKIKMDLEMGPNMMDMGPYKKGV